VRIIEQIGSYAGLAAIPGLAVLSALYFSQARDVRRLREWAGRAPERASEQAMGGRVQVLPGQAVAPGATGAAGPAAAEPGAAAAGATAAKPAVAAAGAATAGAGAAAAKPAAAAAAAAGAQPATAAGPAVATAPGTATGEPATPAGRAAAALGDAEKAASGDGAGPDDAPQQAAAGTNGAGTPADATEDAAGSDEAAAAKPPAKPGALTPAAVASAAAAAKAPARPGATGAARTGPPAVGGVTRPATAGATTPRRHIPSLPHSSRTTVLGKGAPPDEPWYRRLAARLPAGRYVALIVAGALVLGGGAAFAISQLAGGDENGGSSASKSPSGTPANPGDNSPSKKDDNVRSSPTVDPTKVTVTVVNGTTIPNLARDTAAKLQAIGFQIGNKVTGTGSLAAAESVVEYRPGAEAEARYVAAKLNISQKQPADPDAIAQAGPAQVIVVLGADQAPGG
jgi:hypothetical protein